MNITADMLRAIARQAGAVIMEIYNHGFTASQKPDYSPVTEADIAAEALILKELAQLVPDIPVIAEEAAACDALPVLSGHRFFLVDPLDGTKEFIARNGEFTVNIALIENGVPILGVVHLPVTGETYTGVITPHGSHAMRAVGAKPPEPIAARNVPPQGATLAISRSHADQEKIKAISFGVPIAETCIAGSSLKFCRVAEGKADLYPRLGPTMEWDTAAGQAVLVAAGGSVRTITGDPLTYGKPDFRNPHFIARGRTETSA